MMGSATADQMEFLRAGLKESAMVTLMNDLMESLTVDLKVPQKAF
jgi:hypothetical protein